MMSVLDWRADRRPALEVAPLAIEPTIAIDSPTTAVAATGRRVAGFQVAMALLVVLIPVASVMASVGVAFRALEQGDPPVPNVNG